MAARNSLLMFMSFSRMPNAFAIPFIFSSICSVLLLSIPSSWNIKRYAVCSSGTSACRNALETNRVNIFFSMPVSESGVKPQITNSFFCAVSSPPFRSIWYVRVILSPIPPSCPSAFSRPFDTTISSSFCGNFPLESSPFISSTAVSSRYSILPVSPSSIRNPGSLLNPYLRKSFRTASSSAVWLSTFRNSACHVG